MTRRDPPLPPSPRTPDPVAPASPRTPWPEPVTVPRTPRCPWATLDEKPSVHSHSPRSRSPFAAYLARTVPAPPRCRQRRCQCRPWPCGRAQQPFRLLRFPALRRQGLRPLRARHDRPRPRCPRPGLRCRLRRWRRTSRRSLPILERRCRPHRCSDRIRRTPSRSRSIPGRRSGSRYRRFRICPGRRGRSHCRGSLP